MVRLSLTFALIALITGGLTTSATTSVVDKPPTINLVAPTATLTQDRRAPSGSALFGEQIGRAHV